MFFGFDDYSVDELLEYIKIGTDDRLYAIAQLIRLNTDLNRIYNATKIDMFFIEKFKNIVEFENVLKANPKNIEALKDAKKMGVSDKFIGERIKRRGKVNCSLTAERYNNAHRLFKLNNIHYILHCKRLKIELIGGCVIS